MSAAAMGAPRTIAEFLIFCAWLDWLAGVAPCPSRWPYSGFNRGPVEKLLARVKFAEPSVGANPQRRLDADYVTGFDDPTTEPGPSTGETT